MLERSFYVIHFDKYILNHLFLQVFFVLSVFLVNSPQALSVSLGCLKCISGINWSSANKNCLLFHTSYDAVKLK